METDFIFFSSKITVDRDCSLEIKTWLFLGRKAMTNSILKSRDITLPTKVCVVKAMTNLDSILQSKYITLLKKVCIIKAMVFPVVMYGCESWMIKKAER